MTYSIGIDSGSTATKGILLADGVITRRFLVPTPFRPATAITEAWETLREGLETTPFLTLTGYGRQLVDFADKQVTGNLLSWAGRTVSCASNARSNRHRWSGQQSDSA